MFTKKNFMIQIISGLHIGDSKDSVNIGGCDSPVVKDVTGRPYIPGSSIKGKLRSLLEAKLNKISTDGRPHGCNDAACNICALFGTSSNDAKFRGRLIVRDSFVSPSQHNRKENDFFEIKAETAIDRTSGKALNGSLRFTERVVPGTQLMLEVVLRWLPEDDENRRNQLINLVEDCLLMLQSDYLGGKGSRGYGKISIEAIA